MSLYLLILVCLSLAYIISLSIKSKRYSLALLLVSLSLMAVPNGLRASSVGTDSAMYETIFTHLQSGWRYCPVEIGYCQLNRLLASHGFSFQTIFIIESIVLYSALAYFIVQTVNQRDWQFVVLLFYVMQCFFIAMNISRQYFAISFCLIAYVLFLNKKYASSFVFIIISYFIHQTSVCVLLIPICYHLMKTKRYKMLILIGYLASLIIRIIGPSALFAPFLSIIPKYRVYLYSAAFTQATSLSYSIITLAIPNSLFLYFLYILFTNKNFRSILFASRYNLTAFSCSVAYILSLNAFSGVMALARFSDYFLFGFIAFICIMTRNLDRKSAFLLRTLIICGYGVMCLYFVFIVGYHEVIPYRIAEL